jgi:iron(III) transport system substrate-binding protein
MLRGFGVILMALLAFLVACAPAPAAPTVKQNTAADVLAYRGADRQQLLEQGARSEGKLLWYTALTAAATPLAEAFQQKYPFVKVEVYRAGLADLQSRISAEVEAKQPSFDAIEANLPLLLHLRDAGLLAPYFTPEAARYPDAARTPLGDGLVYWTVDRETYTGFAYNTNLIREEHVPKTYRDLLNPALRGKMAVVGSDVGVWVFGNLLTHQGDEFVRHLAQQEVSVQLGAGQAVADLIASGEIPASFSMGRSNVVGPMRKGAPIRWVPLDPATVGSGGTAIAASVAHPHADALFADFVLSPEGQKLFESYEYGSPVADPGFKRWEPTSGLSAAEFEQKFGQWEQLLKAQFFRR